MKNLFFNTKDVRRATYTWNLIYSLVFGFQSVFILIVLTRTVGIEESGIFTIAYANASLFFLGCKYGVRNYQVSDVNNEHSFSDYLCHRWICIFIFFVFELVYILLNAHSKEYNFNKTIIIILVCLLKVPDTIEDVYAGAFQKLGRLDIAVKMMAVRLLISTIFFMVVVGVIKNLILAVILSVVVSTGLLVVEIIWSKSDLNFGTVKWSSIRNLFIACFPLFAGTFLNQYINNAPKYAIDGALSNELQAHYGFIAMPVFVIGLLNNVVFAPIIHGMAKNWDLHENKIFLRKLFKQLLIICGISVVALTSGYVLGIPVLSFLYNTNLENYKSELLVLLLAGDFLAVSGVLNTVITIIRWQKYLLFGYLVIAVAALIGCSPIVTIYGIRGVAFYYMVLTMMMSLVFALIFVVGYKKNEV